MTWRNDLEGATRVQGRVVCCPSSTPRPANGGQQVSSPAATATAASAAAAADGAAAAMLQAMVMWSRAALRLPSSCHTAVGLHGHGRWNVMGCRPKSNPLGTRLSVQLGEPVRSRRAMDPSAGACRVTPWRSEAVAAPAWVAWSGSKPWCSLIWQVGAHRGSPMGTLVSSPNQATRPAVPQSVRLLNPPPFLPYLTSSRRPCPSQDRQRVAPPRRQAAGRLPPGAAAAAAGAGGAGGAGGSIQQGGGPGGEHTGSRTARRGRCSGWGCYPCRRRFNRATGDRDR